MKLSKSDPKKAAGAVNGKKDTSGIIADWLGEKDKGGNPSGTKQGVLALGDAALPFYFDGGLDAVVDRLAKALAFACNKKAVEAWAGAAWVPRYADWLVIRTWEELKTKGFDVQGVLLSFPPTGADYFPSPDLPGYDKERLLLEMLCLDRAGKEGPQLLSFLVGLGDHFRGRGNSDLAELGKGWEMAFLLACCIKTELEGTRRDGGTWWDFVEKELFPRSVDLRKEAILPRGRSLVGRLPFEELWIGEKRLKLSAQRLDVAARIGIFGTALLAVRDRAGEMCFEKSLRWCLESFNPGGVKPKRHWPRFVRGLQRAQGLYLRSADGTRSDSLLVAYHLPKIPEFDARHCRWRGTPSRAAWKKYYKQPVKIWFRYPSTVTRLGGSAAFEILAGLAASDARAFLAAVNLNGLVWNERTRLNGGWSPDLRRYPLLSPKDRRRACWVETGQHRAQRVADDAVERAADAVGLKVLKRGKGGEFWRLVPGDVLAVSGPKK